jgi:signal transduction histidine kinase
MSQDPISRREGRVLLLTAYLLLAVVGVAGLKPMYEQGGRWEIAAGLLLAFSILQTWGSQVGVQGWQSHLYLAVQGGLVAGLLALESGNTVFAFIFYVLSPQAMLLSPQRWGMLWVGVYLLVSGGFYLRAYGWPDGLVSLLLYAAGIFFFGIFGHAVVRVDAARKESQALLAELQEAHRQLQTYADRVEELAIAEERNRLAREMHDTLGHRLTVAAVQLEGAQRLIPQDPQRAAGMVGVVREQVSEALSELRRTVATLRAPLEEDLQLRSALQRLVRHFEEATGITVHLLLPDERAELSDPYRLALYRAAQEALTNVQRHAQARDVWLQLTWQDGMVALLVGDNGVGLSREVEQSGFGLRGLRERAAQLGGEFYVEPRPGGGTQLSLRLPLPVEGGDG